MKIAITGHTSGIGRALYNLLLDDHDVIGFSRSNGFDLNHATARNQILEYCQDVDIFINNAYVASAQTKLFEAFIRAWQDKDKLLINISSKGVIESDAHLTAPDYYINDKKRQNFLFFLNGAKQFPRILNVLLGFVDTPLVAHIDTKKMSPELAAQQIINVMENQSFHKKQIIIDMPCDN
jgi:NAD(P)-dependent dehydrogenase (short-subunit alcohol dehydrogenase family)